MLKISFKEKVGELDAINQEETSLIN
jgi:hypothetical protein